MENFSGRNTFSKIVAVIVKEGQIRLEVVFTIFFFNLFARNLIVETIPNRPPLPPYPLLFFILMRFYMFYALSCFRLNLV